MYEEALVHGDRPVLTGLLEDLHRLATGAPTVGRRGRGGGRHWF